MIKYISNSESTTQQIAFDFAKTLKNTDVVVITGELGVGKTKFVYGVCKYFGIENLVSSPTFTIVNEYISNLIKIFHLDVYRLNDSIDFEESVGTEYFNNGICIIEWGEKIKDILPKSTIYIDINKDQLKGENHREIIIKKEDEL